MKQKVNFFNPLAGLIFFGLAISCTPRQESSSAIIQSSDWALAPFEKVDSVNPVLVSGDLSFHCPVLDKPVRWEEKDVFNPAAIVRDDKVFLLFRAEDKIGRHAGTSRIGVATSTDGLNFTKSPTPVLYPENDSLKVYEWEGGVEDPRVVETETGEYLMTYTAYDGETARLMLATSTDLMHWKKHGPALQGKYKNIWSKSGAIVTTREGERIIAKKINGKYWMYFGDTDLFIASSDDLLKWTVEEQNGALRKVLSPRPGKFDSRLVESGPYALLKDDGILLIYNGMNLDVGGDTSLASGAYCGGQALFDKSNPMKLIARLEAPFICPDKKYEIEGQVNHVCFLEGLVLFKGRWFLYYGTADSRIAVAVH